MVEYFSSFPKIQYNNRTITDITERIDILQKIKDNIVLFQYTQVVDGQRPEDIADKWYGDPTLFWIILYVNDIIDPYYDWILTDTQLLTYIQNTYGVENVFTIHHYETITGSDLPLGTWVNFGTPFSTSVTNYDYESRLNEIKRKIKILKPSYINQVLTEYKKSF